MFKVKYKYGNHGIYQVLDVRYDEYYNQLMFLMWYKDNWKWVRADNFVPPNYEI